MATIKLLKKLRSATDLYTFAIANSGLSDRDRLRKFTCCSIHYTETLNAKPLPRV
ncbi:hypothetical protein H6F50_19995 [Coleofasciculus sp. FACHB-712]|uniref:hypothetical protein n=1 Tax=Cyanophyceae TaxID=3028117 RepID=UPI0016832162|nr:MULTISPECIES: hypothetical protein [unclassified Coleofasciculus]MBD1890347.1 hypothetical protein [Coleofasciculus sp. FACHB-SPT9]MBD1944610.1 hypothetical protein [Coleofasciculus sp. FACHB-712]